MTFDEWWKDKTAATGELRDFGRKRKAYEVCWHAAQAQCAAGPWRPIAEYPKTEHELYLVKMANTSCWCVYWDAENEEWYAEDQESRFRNSPTHFAPLREVQP